VTGSGPITVSTTYPGGGSATFISANSTGSAPGTVYVSVIPQAVGTYSGTVNITVNGSTISVPVNYTVSSNPVLIANPGSINFTATGGSSSTTTMSITASDNSSLPMTLTSNQSWVTIAGGTSGTTPANFQVTVNPSGLANGINTATITATATGASNSPMSIPVVVLVSGSSGGGGGSGNLTISSSTLTFNTTVGGGSPGSQVLSINSNSGVSTSFSLSVTANACNGSFNWISASPQGNLFTPQTVTVQANGPTNTAATCTGTITLVSGGLTQTVQVVENIGTSGGGGGGGTGNVTVTPSSLTFSYQTGGGTPAIQSLSVKSASGSTGVGFTAQATTSTGGNWLTVGVASATTPVDALPVSVSVTGLSPGTYQGNIKITPNGGTVVNVPVTLTIQSQTVSATPTSLTFNYRAGDQTPASQAITVSGGSNDLPFTAAASSNGNWLSVSPATGTTGTSGTQIQASINPTGLTAGNYTGTITVAGSGQATGSTTINVSLTVTAPLPTISKVTNAASYASGSIAAGEIITVFGTNIGPTTLVTFSLDSSGKVPTTLGGVQVLVGGYPAPLLYVRNDQIAAITPYEIAAPFLAGPNVVVKYLGQSSNGVPLNQVAAAPGLFTSNQSGTGPGAILNGNSSVNSSSNPAAKNETIQIFLTGEGQTSPAGVTGSVTPVTVNTPKPLLSVAVLIDGQPANVTFFGEAPGLVAGVLQVNAQIPPNSRSGDVSVQVNIGGNTSQSGVTVAVR
jgi:uncharacterized protein (TIGR03437 family)